MALEAEKEAAERELNAAASNNEDRLKSVLEQRAEMARSRKVSSQSKASRPKASEAGA
jgi:hypothetical protein